MLKGILAKEEKKVEYLELIYDLIFVYVIGRNNQVLHYIENGFVTVSASAAIPSELKLSQSRSSSLDR